VRITRKFSNFPDFLSMALYPPTSNMIFTVSGAEGYVNWFEANLTAAHLPIYV